MSAQEMEWGNGMGKWEEGKGFPINLAWDPGGLIPP